MFIKYKTQAPINIFLIYCIRFHEQKEHDGMSYIIEFCGENMSVYWWEFSTKEERDDVYKKVLKTIEVKEISLSSGEPPIELMETV